MMFPISQNQTSHSKALIWEKDNGEIFHFSIISYIQYSTTRNQQALFLPHLFANAQANEISNFCQGRPGICKYYLNAVSGFILQ
jgi:hypothetical protein